MLEAPDCIDYYPRWVDDADQLFALLRDEIAWEQHTITLYGRTVPTPRLTAWMGDGAYRYSGIVNAPAPWPGALAELRERLATSWMLTSIPALPISIGMAPTQWAITAITSQSWVRDRQSHPSALGTGDGLCCGIGAPARAGAGTSATVTCWSCGMSHKATTPMRCRRRRTRSGLG